ncbi:MAG TPA: sulfatase-like hydrolase/transferase [Gaiellaceae bacterium]|nr:sulfatase-like hydrolase/transferase [Gaiellaceae bacterium]
MTMPFKGVINVDVKESVPDRAPYTQPIAPEGTPNVLYIVLDDVGFSAPMRACLLTGRNHTSNGMACITEASGGFPNQNGHIPFECGTLAEVLGERGWNTYMVGKWHLTAEDEMNLASRKSQWPLGRRGLREGLT